MTVRTIEWNDPVGTECQGGALSVGNFDGVHRGHQTLLAELRRQADAAGGPAVVLTFEPHPVCLLRPESCPPLLTTVPRRAELLQRHGADHVVVLRTTPQLLGLHAREFFDHVLVGHFRPRAVVPGFNFAFGKGREGTVEKLRELCQDAGVGFVLVPPLQPDGLTVSSSRVRAALQAGDVGEAALLLGRPYELSGRVGVGARRGRTLGFPTANLEEVETLLPANGVYAVRAHFGGQAWPAAANVGPNPTFGEGVRKLEVHLIGFAGDLYGHTLAVDFLGRLRETRPFTGVEELKEQLRRDVAAAGRVCQE